MQRNLHVEGTRMQRNLLFVLISVMTACGVGVAHSKDCQGVDVPEQVQLDGGACA